MSPTKVREFAAVLAALAAVGFSPYSPHPPCFAQVGGQWWTANGGHAWSRERDRGPGDLQDVVPQVAHAGEAHPRLAGPEPGTTRGNGKAGARGRRS